DRELACAFFDGVRWRDPRVLAGASGLPMALGVTWASGAFHLAWVGDQDGDLTTTGDRFIYTAAADAGGRVIAAPSPLGGKRDRPWPVIGAVRGQPALLFAGDPGPSGARPLLESRFTGGAWPEPRDTQLKVGPLARGRLFDGEGE